MIFHSELLFLGEFRLLLCCNNNEHADNENSDTHCEYLDQYPLSNTFFVSLILVRLGRREM